MSDTDIHGKFKDMTIRQFLHSRSFNYGFNSIKKGLPLEEVYNDDFFERELYEIGRQFSCVYSGKIKDGKKIRMWAIQAFYNSFMNKDFIIATKI